MRAPNVLRELAGASACLMMRWLRLASVRPDSDSAYIDIEVSEVSDLNFVGAAPLPPQRGAYPSARWNG